MKKFRNGLCKILGITILIAGIIFIILSFYQVFLNVSFGIFPYKNILQLIKNWNIGFIYGIIGLLLLPIGGYFIAKGRSEDE